MVFNRIIKLSLLSILLIGACTCGKNKHIPDVRNIKVDLKIERFDKLWFSIPENESVEVYLDKLKSQHPHFTTAFEQFILERGKPLPDTTTFDKLTRQVYLDKHARKLYDTCQQVFGDFKGIEKELTEAFRFYKYYFPKREVPVIYPYISYYSYATPVVEGGIGIGLDFFLGENHKDYYANPNLRNAYIVRTLNKLHLPAKVMYALADDIVGSPTGPRMIDFMVNEGKKLYLLDCFLPHTPDSIKLGWTQRQVDFNESGEKSLYNLLVRENLIYSTKNADFRKFVSPGPFMEGMASENPGNSGSWLGWQMVKQYMDRDDKKDVEAMLRADAQRILQRYRP